MSTPLTAPKFMASAAVLDRVSINYSPVWDGANWILTPADISVVSTGKLVDGGVEASGGGLTLAATDLPAAGQTALQDLFGYLEQEMADRYS